MTQSPRRDDELRELIERFERAFDPARNDPRAHDAEPPVSVEAAPPAPRRLSLPLTRPWLVYALLAVNALMFALSWLVAQRLPMPYVDAAHGTVIVDRFTAALYVLGAKDNQAIDAGQWWRLLTPMVLHGSLLHLLFNAWALYLFGTDVERVYGTLRFAAIYLLAGLAGSIASYVFNPGGLAVGASGAIFGLLGALAAFAYQARTLIGREASKMQIGQMATLAAINLLLGFATPNIDNAAHIGGLIVGTLAGLALAPRYVLVRDGWLPRIQRRDHALLGWLGATALLIALIVWFVWRAPL